jgi:hypothetical protein
MTQYTSAVRVPNSYFFVISNVVVEAGLGTVDLNTFPVIPQKPPACDIQVQGICILRTGYSFAAHHGTYFDDWTLVQFGINTSGRVEGTYTITLLSEVPLPATLPLFAGGLGILGLLGWRRRQKAASR